LAFKFRFIIAAQSGRVSAPILSANGKEYPSALGFMPVQHTSPAFSQDISRNLPYAVFRVFVENAAAPVVYCTGLVTSHNVRASGVSGAHQTKQNPINPAKESVCLLFFTHLFFLSHTANYANCHWPLGRIPGSQGKDDYKNV
jgi:hypothetical protein